MTIEDLFGSDLMTLMRIQARPRRGVAFDPKSGVKYTGASAVQWDESVDTDEVQLFAPKKGHRRATSGSLTTMEMFQLARDAGLFRSEPVQHEIIRSLQNLLSTRSNEELTEQVS